LQAGGVSRMPFLESLPSPRAVQLKPAQAPAW